MVSVARLVFVLAALWVLLASADVHAQASGSEAEARARFEAGRGHARAERWADALLEFQASEALVPRAVTEFNLAATLLRLGRAREALAMVERLEARSDLDDRIATDVVALRAAARDAIRTLAVAVAPASARIEVDGSVIEGTGSPRAIPLDPGPHTIVVTAAGYSEHRATLAADAVTLGVELAPLPAVIVVDASEPDARIAIDGADVGLGHVETEVSVGAHVVYVTREGRAPFEADVTVGAGERIVVRAALPLPVAPPPTPLHEEPLLWVGVGVGVLAIAGVVIGVVIATAPQPSGGSTGIVIAPLARF